jgi:GNAT superfamily N-acetyltransferase
LNQELTAQYPEEGANFFRLDPEEVSEGRGAFLVAFLRSAAVGCGAVRLLDSATAELKRMFIALPARRKGIGRILLTELELEARRLGARRLLLETGPRQEAALAMYRGAGFHEIPCFGEYVGSPQSVCLAKEMFVTQRATGTFDVKLAPQARTTNAEDATLGRMSIDKQFHGDLEASSKGEMLSALTAVKGSAGYVAIERVRGTLHGRAGTFALQHNGTMTRGEPQLAVTVVPDSGTDQLEGLAGKMAINISAGKHFYDFEYSIANNP